ncbi:MAG: hypothetical protein OXF41_21350 [bacterium]|nr:hypothetical protein [bacterium]
MRSSTEALQLAYPRTAFIPDRAETVLGIQRHHTERTAVAALRRVFGG